MGKDHDSGAERNGKRMNDSVKKQFQKWAYGMFIHYGLYSIHARGEWVLYKERMPFDEYFAVEPDFKPKEGCAEEWTRLAAENGMNYMVLTTRHHDGYFLGRKLVGEFCDACRKYGLGVGLYYSVMDWTDPDFQQGQKGPNWERFVAKTHRQIKELMTDYGKVDYLFYDGCPLPDTWRAAELHDELRRLQPDMLISCRCGLDEDVYSSEQHSGAFPGRTWESCYTINHSWGYNQYDMERKSPQDIACLLMALRHNGGNLLLNIGPLPDGSIPAKDIEILKSVGGWLKANGDAVYDVEPHPFQYMDQEISTARGDTAYIALTSDYPGYRRMLCGIGNKVNRISQLSDGREIGFEQHADRIRLLDLGDRQEGELLRVLKLELDGRPFGADHPMRPAQNIRTQ